MAGPKSILETLHPHGDFPAELVDSGFFRGESLSGLAPNNFSSKIHKIFARERFPEDIFNYVRLELSLRMASALVKAAIPVFHSILVKGARPTQMKTESGKPIYVFPKPVEILTREQVHATWTRLGQLADGLSYIMDATNMTSSAWCQRLDKPDGSLGPDLQGCGSLICIAGGIYQLVAHSFEDDETDIIAQQATSFHLAATLIHELTHAAVNANTLLKDRTTLGQYYLGDALTTEMGFETEAWLFGGVTICQAFHGFRAYYNEDAHKHSRLSYLLTVHEYPCPSKTGIYCQHTDNLTVRGGEKTSEIVWHASFLKIHSFHQDEFWATTFPKYGRRALFFEKDTGYRFKARVNERTLEPVLPHPSDAACDDIPSGHWVDKTGMIRKKVNKIAKLKHGESHDMEVEIRVRNIVATGIMQTDWKPLSLGEKADAWKRKISKEIIERAADTAALVKEKSQQTTKKVKEKATDTVQSAGGTWELTGMNLRVMADMVKSKGY